MSEKIQIPAIKFKQGNDRELYSFVVDGKSVPRFANIIRIGRDEERQHELFGYQRPEVFSHIKEIRRYLESENPLMPNALVLAFNEGVSFKQFGTKNAKNCNSVAGVLEIPCSDDEAQKIGWIVDGQQRTAAIREAELKSFPVSVVAFIADEKEQREQFILVNSTKPLPKDLIYELLPATEARLAQPLERRKIPALISARLNYPKSGDRPTPFAGRIKTPTNRNAKANISYNSVLKMIENSMSDGALMSIAMQNEAESAIDQMVDLLNAYWGAVEEIFPLAWSLPPSKSRLTHGAGMVAMGFLMDAIVEREKTYPTMKKLGHEVRKIETCCHWTAGCWVFAEGQKRWNEIQNIPKDIEVLAANLLKAYLEA